ncbi:hypothetical protein QTP88_012693 [Uroleucon formosanum]
MKSKAISHCRKKFKTNNSASNLLKNCYEQLKEYRCNFNDLLEEANMVAKSWSISKSFEKKRYIVYSVPLIVTEMRTRLINKWNKLSLIHLFLLTVYFNINKPSYWLLVNSVPKQNPIQRKFTLYNIFSLKLAGDAI